MINSTPTATTAKSVPAWLVPVAATVGVILGCCGGFTFGSLGEPEPKVITVSSPSPYAVTTIVTVEPSPPASPPSPTAAATPVIEEGTWTVGDDFPAGTYRVREAVTSTCYWGIYKSGTNQGTIIENDIVTGGRPTVTLKRGQDFTTTRCGTWVKIR